MQDFRLFSKTVRPPASDSSLIVELRGPILFFTSVAVRSMPAVETTPDAPA
jgi:hypothetical protein